MQNCRREYREKDSMDGVVKYCLEEKSLRQTHWNFSGVTDASRISATDFV